MLYKGQQGIWSIITSVISESILSLRERGGGEVIYLLCGPMLAGSYRNTDRFHTFSWYCIDDNRPTDGRAIFYYYYFFLSYETEHHLRKATTTILPSFPSIWLMLSCTESSGILFLPLLPSPTPPPQ